jgi:hypothetical protein
MIIYIILPLICFLFYFDTWLKKESVLKSLFLIFLVIFLCSGYMTGTDWRMYEDIYNTIGWHDLKNYSIEKGFYILILLFKSIKIDFWVFLITIKTIIFFVFLHLSKVFNISKWLYLGLSFPFFMYLFIDNPLRNLIAIAIFILSIKYLINNKPIKYILLIILAAQFHISALMLLLIYPIKNMNLSSSTLVILYLTFFIIFSSQTILIYLLYKILMFSPFLFGRLNSYLTRINDFEVSGSIISLRSIILLGVFFLMIYYRKKIVSNFNLGWLVFLLSMVYLVSFRLGLSFQVLTRLTYYFFFFYLFIIILLGNTIKRVLLRSLFWMMFVLITLYSSFSLATVDYRYVPYSNYIIHAVSGNLLDHEYRCEFNIKNSPYRDKK